MSRISLVPYSSLAPVDAKQGVHAALDANLFQTYVNRYVTVTLTTYFAYTLPQTDDVSGAIFNEQSLTKARGLMCKLLLNDTVGWVCRPSALLYTIFTRVMMP